MIVRCLVAASVWLACSAGAAESETEDSPYVPSPHSVVAEMLALAEVGPEDYLIDLGSGDGRIVLTAAKVLGARGLGVEIREDLVALSREAAVAQGVADRVRFVQQDLFETDISEATVVTLYLLPDTVNRLRDKLLWELEPGTRVLSHDYPIEGWKSERMIRLEHPDKVAVTGVPRTNIYLYRVPAEVAGRWRASVPAAVAREPLELEFVQSLNRVIGRAHRGGETIPLEDVSLEGREISFVLPEREAHFVGRVHDATIEGTVTAGAARGAWRAARRNPDG